MGTWMVVGANRGIGLEMARLLKKRGEQVIATCRSKSKELESLGVDIVDGVDLTTDAGVEKLRNGKPVDVLVVMAGVLKRVALSDLRLDLIREQLEINALGPLRAAEASLSRLHAGSKIALVTSRMGSIADNSSGGHYAYRMSKAALNAAGKSLSIDLRDRGIAVCLLHPGFVRTDMTGHNGDIDPGPAAQRLIDRIDALTLETTGAFLHGDGTQLPW
jgi:NAD(P)-dependent dehydrogenase (short-subunit alcohol dehydrogenase family)